jgi:hypothetical protein
MKVKEKNFSWGGWLFTKPTALHKVVITDGNLRQPKAFILNNFTNMLILVSLEIRDGRKK